MEKRFIKKTTFWLPLMSSGMSAVVHAAMAYTWASYGAQSFSLQFRKRGEHAHLKKSDIWREIRE